MANEIRVEKCFYDLNESMDRYGKLSGAEVPYLVFGAEEELEALKEEIRKAEEKAAQEAREKAEEEAQQAAQEVLLGVGVDYIL